MVRRVSVRTVGSIPMHFRQFSSLAPALLTDLSDKV